MTTLEEKITAIEDEIRETPYNKASQHHIGRLKAKIAQLRETLEHRSGKGGKGVGFAVKKSGDATVALVGFPSVGKSTLLNKLTDANSRVGAYDFTTVDVIPGTMFYKGLSIQILDIPGIIGGAARGKGRGREVISIARNANLIIILLDILHLEHLKTIEKELNNAGIRLGQTPPKATIKKTMRGGLKVVSSVPLKKINERTIREIVNINGIHSADITLHEDMDEERFIDAVMKNRVYSPYVIALNKIDTADAATVADAKKKLGGDAVLICAEKAENLEELKEKIFRKLDLIRIYMKPHGGEPDFDEPLIVRRGSTIGEICDIVHKDIRKKFKHAAIIGKSARFAGQEVGLDHVVLDEDIITIIKNR
jgi:hypothetical protein